VARVQPAPTAAATIEQYESLLAGRLSRDVADRWAAQWVTASEPPRMEPAIWTALTHLCGCDLKHGPNGSYLHSEAQLHEWMLDLKGAAANSMGVPPNKSLERTRDE
jgi:hypothetical protein